MVQGSGFRVQGSGFREEKRMPNWRAMHALCDATQKKNYARTCDTTGSRTHTRLAAPRRAGGRCTHLAMRRSCRGCRRHALAPPRADIYTPCVRWGRCPCLSLLHLFPLPHPLLPPERRRHVLGWRRSRAPAPSPPAGCWQALDPRACSSSSALLVTFHSGPFKICYQSCFEICCEGSFAI